MLPKDFRDRKIPRNELLELVSVLVLYVGLHSISAYTSGPIDFHQPENLCYAIGYNLGLAGLFLSLLLRDRTWPAPLPSGAKQWGAEIILGLITFLFAYIASKGFSNFLQTIGLEHHVVHKTIRDYLKTASDSSTFFFSVSLFFSSAREEIFFRAYLIHKSRLLLKGDFWPVLLSSALFSVVHGYDLFSALSIFFYGLIFGAIYVLSPRLPKLILAHWLIDLVSYFRIF